MNPWPSLNNFRFLSEQGLEFALLFVVLLDAAGEDVVVPAVDFNFVMSQGAGDGGLSAEIVELGDDVAAEGIVFLPCL